MGVTPAEMRAVNAHLIPLIAHDRAGFGGALVCAGLTMFACVLCARPSRALWQALALAGAAGFGTAIGIHPVIGYTSASHLGPAVFGCAVFAMGLALAAPVEAATRWPRCSARKESPFSDTEAENPSSGGGRTL